MPSWSNSTGPQSALARGVYGTWDGAVQFETLQKPRDTLLKVPVRLCEMKIHYVTFSRKHHVGADPSLVIFESLLSGITRVTRAIQL